MENFLSKCGRQKGKREQIEEADVIIYQLDYKGKKRDW